MNNRKTIKIVGSCSKWIDGEGWVTEIPISQIENIFYIGKNIIVIDKQDFQKKVEELGKWQRKAINYYKMAKSYGIECIIDTELDETLKEYEL